MTNKYMILHADDFGMCHAHNEATLELLDEGDITSASIMVPCPWFQEAAAYARSHPEKCIGVHTTLTAEWELYRWGPVSHAGVDSLIVDGYFPKDVLTVEQRSLSAEVEREIRAQIALAVSAGVNITHLDNHMGSVYGLYGVQSHMPLILRICSEMGVPFRFPTSALPGDAIMDRLPEEIKAGLNAVAQLAASLNVPVLDCLLAHPFEALPGETYESFRDMVCEKFTRLPDGIHELYIHPAVDSPELRAVNPQWLKRVWEYQLPKDPLFKEAVQQAGIQLISWCEVWSLRGMSPAVK